MDSELGTALDIIDKTGTWPNGDAGTVNSLLSRKPALPLMNFLVERLTLD